MNQLKPLLYVLETNTDLVDANGNQDADAAQEKAIEELASKTADLVAAAALGMVAAYRLHQAILMGSRPTPESDDSEVNNAADELDDRERALSQVAGMEIRSYRDAASGVLQFPPGHPLPGQVYRRHPLSPVKADKRDLYIPIESYDDLLLREREAELIRLLVRLGATRICIRKVNAAKAQAEANMAVGIQHAGKVEGGIGAGTAASSEDTRSFRLRGKPWTEDFPLNRSEFAWLPFEPSWDAIVDARLVGGCTTASVELKSSTEFSVQAKFGLGPGLLSHVAQADGGVAAALDLSDTYLIEVDFAE